MTAHGMLLHVVECIIEDRGGIRSTETKRVYLKV